MARKIICDRCGRECTGTHGTLSLSRAQRASTGEQVGYDEFAHLDLCDICTEVARTEWKFRIAQGYPKDELMLARGAHTIEIEAGEHYTPPEDSEVPRTLAVGMTVDRAIATRWNTHGIGEAETEVLAPAEAEGW
jgi:hypothetical protein